MAADGTHGYVYDGDNRLTCVKGTDGSCTSAWATVYTYDAGGPPGGEEHGDGGGTLPLVYGFTEWLVGGAYIAFCAMCARAESQAEVAGSHDTLYVSWALGPHGTRVAERVPLALSG
jgi:hypothetical protein